MARKPTPHPLHPLRMVEALEALNAASGLFAAKVHAAVSILEMPALTLEQARSMGVELSNALTEWRAVIWPEAE